MDLDRRRQRDYEERIGGFQELLTGDVGDPFENPNYFVGQRVRCAYCQKALLIYEGITLPNNGIPYCKECYNLFSLQGKIINDAIPNSMNPEAG